MRIRWTARARAHLDDIGRHISQHNPVAAGRVVQRIISLVDNLSEQPEMGRRGRVVRTRELVVADFPYIVAYRVRLREVEILAVFHALRRWPERF